MKNTLQISVIELPDVRPKAEEAKTENKVPPPYLTMFIAEFVATALLLFMGCMGCMSNFDSQPIVHHLNPITFALCVLLIIQMFGHISGAHLNPAVTLASLLLGQMSIKMALIYVGAQFLGATVGFGLLRYLLPEGFITDGFCMTTLHPAVTPLKGLTIETIITAILIFVCCAVWDKRNWKNTDSTPLRFALIIAAIGIAAGPLTGASMNTARSFGPLVYGGNWEHQWIYLVGPTLGSMIACAFYKTVFTEKNLENYCSDENVHLEEIDGNGKI